MQVFDNELFRFGTCGTLILCHGIAERIARRRSARLAAPAPRRPLALTLWFTASVLAFYLLIGPHGGVFLGGWGNAAGIAGALLAAGLRLFATHSPLGTHSRFLPRSALRLPADLATRLLFYVALPAAVGVPLGWAVLTLPAWIASLYYTRREVASLPASHPIRSVGRS